ncbi:hypothetical protein P7K49_008865 [Saguinus oedipus]|uniref:Signal recognition particle SRP72 subunit RNA-binding domain-containing protein n=1 Tax=Saguinus oedipus TaxID=9490 RepID=A0ABQ9VYY5_SAGOE|nr:hypothetical protein P7K49_008865 [Saguinus oedipus]
MNTNQAEQCRKIPASLQSQSPEHLLPVLIQAAQYYCEKQHMKAIELLQEFSDQHPENAAEIKKFLKKAKAPSKHSPLSDSTSLKADAEALENSSGATYIQKKGGKVTGDRQPKEQELGDLKKKGNLPKNYDPKVTPDPER